MQRHRVTSLEQKNALKQRIKRCRRPLKPKPEEPVKVKTPFTIKDRIAQKIQKVQKWEAANPGLSWENPKHKKGKAVSFQREMLKSVAYRSLSRVGFLLLSDFMMKRLMKPVGKERWVVENNGNIIFSYSEAQDKGYSSGQFRDGVDELQSKGFIDITHLGKGGRAPVKGTGDCTKYWIDDRWKQFGTSEFKPPRKPRRKDERKGRGWSVLMNDPERKKQILDKRTTVKKDSS